MVLWKALASLAAALNARDMLALTMLERRISSHQSALTSNKCSMTNFTLTEESRQYELASMRAAQRERLRILLGDVSSQAPILVSRCVSS